MRTAASSYTHNRCTGHSVAIGPQMRKASLKLQISNLIDVLTDQRDEDFCNEKHVAWMTFCAWAYWPNDSELIRHAHTVAMANLFEKSSLSVQRELLPHLSTRKITDALLRPPLTATYRAAMEQKDPAVSGISNIVAFFMHCPTEYHPSLLKALYFIDEGGLIDKDEWSAEEAKEFKRSPTTLKRMTEKVYARFSPDYLRNAASKLEYDDLGSLNQKIASQKLAK